MSIFSIFKKSTPTLMFFHDDRISVIQIKYSNEKFELIASNQTDLEEGIVKNGTILDMESFKFKLKELFSQATPVPIKTTELYVNIPYHLLFPFVEDTSHHAQKTSMERAMLERVKKHSPILAEDLVIIINTVEKGHKVTSGAYAFPKKWKDRMIQACKTLGIKEIEFIAEPLAHMALLDEELSNDYALFVCQKERVSLSVFHNGLLYDSFSLGEFTPDSDCSKCFQAFQKSHKDFKAQFGKKLNSLYFIGFDDKQYKTIKTHFELEDSEIIFVDGKSSTLNSIMPYKNDMSLIFGMFNLIAERFIEVSE